jgi:hypothetical protein
MKSNNVSNENYTGWYKNDFLKDGENDGLNGSE